MEPQGAILIHCPDKTSTGDEDPVDESSKSRGDESTLIVIQVCGDIGVEGNEVIVQFQNSRGSGGRGGWHDKMPITGGRRRWTIIAYWRVIGASHSFCEHMNDSTSDIDVESKKNTGCKASERS